MAELSNSPQEPDGTRETTERLLVEYQAAQQSAEHHDSSAWSFISITWGASLVLMGFVLGSAREPGLRVVLSVLSVVGILLVILVWVARNQMNMVKRQKYARCKQLEPVFGFRQHSQLAYRAGSGGVIVAIISLSLVIAWLALLFAILCDCVG